MLIKISAKLRIYTSFVFLEFYVNSASLKYSKKGLYGLNAAKNAGNSIYIWRNSI